MYQKPNKLFEDGPDWEWRENFKDWICIVDGTKFIIWMEILSKDDGSKKLSKSKDDVKILWDGIGSGIHGGPEPNERPGPILSWLRKNYETKRLTGN